MLYWNLLRSDQIFAQPSRFVPALTAPVFAGHRAAAAVEEVRAPSGLSEVASQGVRDAVSKRAVA